MLEDFRTLKQGDEFNFDFSKHPEILIAGDNGCGKSTLVNVIRDYQCDNSKDDPNAVYQTKLGYCDIRGFKNKVEISTDFTRFYFISAEFDDPTSLNNSASAEALLENGGFQTKRMSTGQRGLAMLSKWLEAKPVQASMVPLPLCNNQALLHCSCRSSRVTGVKRSFINLYS